MQSTDEQNSQPNNSINDKVNIEKEQEKIKTEEKINYTAEVKKYLNINLSDKEYSDLITNNPDKIFENIDNKKIALMEALLFSRTPPSGKGEESDILNTKFELNEQRVINNDVKRTRVRESILVKDYQNYLELILTYYCKVKNIGYKQGLNEIFGPLILLKYKFPDIKLKKLFDIGEVFIDQFLPNYFYEKELFSLNSALGLFSILLRYHEPSVYNRLDSNEILPDMYATNWMMTLLSGKLKLYLLFDLWVEIIKIGDPLIMHFVLVSIIKSKRDMIINCEVTFLAALMTSLTITSHEELQKFLNMAKDLRSQTPYSFRILANKIGFLEKNNQNIKNTYELYKPRLIPAMPIFPLEILYITYKSKLDCVDPDCKNSKKKTAISSLDNSEYCIIEHEYESNTIMKFQDNLINNHICEKCDMHIEKNMKYVLLDLRILEYGKDNENIKTGFLPKMVNVDQEELKSEDFNEIISDRFVSERGLFHFIFLTSSTDFYTDFEKSFYKDNTTEEERMKQMFGLAKQTKADKELNLQDATKNLTLKEIYTLKEYDNMRKTLNSMQKLNFPYISFVYGGYKAVHEESFKRDIELLEHNEKYCILCKEMSMKKKKKEKINKKNSKKDNSKKEISNLLWEHKKKVKLSELNKIASDPNNYICYCTLKKYRDKIFDLGEQEQVSLVLIKEKHTLEMYKFDKKKDYDEILGDDSEKEQKKENNKYYDLGKEENDEEKKIMTLFEEIPLKNIMDIGPKPKYKNIINICFKEEITGKKSSKNKKQLNFQMYNMTLDFSSPMDSKAFIQNFKKLVNN